tara:strand:- start:2109 stop:3983 length:1875 start_codon:yes stop_codon:yes gene_type:complete
MAKRLSVSLTLNDKQFQTGLKRASSSLKKFGASMQRTGKSLTTGLTLPIVALGAASVSAFDKQSKAIAQVEAGIKSTGQAAGFTADELMKMASDLQKKTIFGDEDILQGVTAQLLTFTNIAGEQFDRTQLAALNLSTRLDGDLKSASIQLGKALNDPVANLSALSRSGIQFSDSQKETIKSLAETNRLADAQTIILNELDKQYGGAAEAASQAGLGPFQQLQGVLADVSEEFGKLILENLDPLKTALTGVADTLREMSPETKGLIVRIAGIVAVVGPLILIIGKLVQVLGMLGGSIRTINMLMENLARAIALNPMAALITATIALVGVLGFAIFDTEKFIVTAIKMGKVGKTVAKMVLSFLGAISPKYAIMAQNIDTFSDALDDSNVNLDESTTSLEANQKAVENLMNATRNFKPFDPSSGSSTSEPEAFRPEPISAGPIPESTPEVILETTTAIQGATQAVKTLEETMAETANVAGNSFMSMADNSDASLGDMAAGAANAARDIVKIEAAKAVAGYAASIFATVPFPLNLMLAAAAGSVAGSLFAKIIPPFAEGGLVSGATLGMVGEGPGTSMVNPEVIAPLDKLQGMLNQGGSTQVFGRISGSDILLSSDRAKGNRNRTRGY